MPDHNLGTARGEIKVTYDDRSVRNAEDSLKKFQAVAASIDAKLGKMESTLGKIQEEFAGVDKEIEKATKSMTGFGFATAGVDKAVKFLAGDIETLTKNLGVAINMFEKTNMWMNRLNVAANFFQKKAEIGGLFGGARALRQTGLLTLGLTNLSRAFFQVNQSMSVMPSWVRSIKMFADSFRFVDLASKTLLNLVQENPFAEMAGQAYKASSSIARSIGVKVPAAINAMQSALSSAIERNLWDKLTSKISPETFLKLGNIQAGFNIQMNKSTSALGNFVKQSRFLGPVAAAFALTNKRVTDVIKNFANDRYLQVFKNKFRPAYDAVAGLATRFSNFGGEIAKTGQSLSGFIQGLSMVKLGAMNVIEKFKFLGRLPLPVIGALVTAIAAAPAALAILGKALAGVSNLIVGLVDGVKQLSGGLLVLPGAIASIAAVVTTGMAIFSGLGDAFKDIGKGGEEAALAMAAMPKHLQGLARTYQNLLPKMKDVRTALQTTFFAGADVQFQKLGDAYIPTMTKAMQQMAAALKYAKDQMVGFLASGQTRSDVGALYMSASQSMLNFSAAIQPAMAGLRDIGVIGAKFIAEMTGGLPGITQKFAAWASINRENGKLMGWMRDAYSGVADLVKGFMDAGKAALTLLGIFKTNSGDNFLQRFADAMARMNEAVEKSAATGFLRDIKNSVRNLGEEKIKEFGKTLLMIFEAMQQVAPVLLNMSSTFSKTLAPAIEWAVKKIEALALAMKSTNVDNVIGLFLGLYASFKVTLGLVGPLKGLFQILFGVFKVIKNQAAFMTAYALATTKASAALSRFGAMGAMAGARLTSVSTGLTKVASAVGAVIGPLTAVAIAVFAAYSAWDSRNETVKQSLEELNKTMEGTKKFALDLQNAFQADRGTVGKTVVGAVSDRIDTELADLQSRTEGKIGWWQNFGDALKNQIVRTKEHENQGAFEQTVEFNGAQKLKMDADQATEAMKRLGLSTEDIQKGVTGTSSEFEIFSNHIKKSGDGGNELAEIIKRMREEFVKAEEDAKALGQGGADVAEGINKISESAGDATSKLEGLKLILQGLGLIKTDELEALAAYEKGIDDLAASVSDAVSQGSMADLIDANTKSFNVGTEAGRSFFNTIKTLGDQYMANVAAGADANEEYKKFEDQLKNISTTTGISVEDLKNLGAQVGLLPKVAEIAMQLVGANDVTKDMASVLLNMQAKGSQGVEIPVFVGNNAESLSNEIDKIIGRDATYSKGTNLFIRPGVTAADEAAIKAKLGTFGVSFDGVTASNPAQLPIEPTTGSSVGTNGIREPERAAADGISKPVLDSASQIPDLVQEQIDMATSAAQTGGEAFSKNFAEGIDQNTNKIAEAAKRAAEAAASPMPGSPAKTGPLSGDGWTYVRGKSFTSDFAGGIAKEAGKVDEASGMVAGRAADSLGGAGGAKIYGAGKFLGQLSDLTAFAENFVNAMGKIGESVFGFAKFISDPQGKGTFFGKSQSFVKDNSPEAKRAAEDARQARVSGFLGSGQRPDVYDPATGRMKGKDPGDLGPAPAKQDVANYIIDKALSLGYSKAQADEFVVQAAGESGFSGAANGGNQDGTGDVKGIFQFTPGTWKGRSGDVTNPQDNIDAYFGLAAERGLTPENFVAGQQLGTQVSIGGPWHPDNAAKGHLSAAQTLAQQYIAGYQPGAGQLTNGIIPGLPAAVANAAGSKLNAGEGVEAGLEPVAAQVAAMLSSMFPGITDIGGKQNRPKGSPQIHTEGRALDVMTGQSAKLGDEIAAFVEANYAKLGIQSYIWKDIGKNLVQNEGGGPGSTYTAAGHGGASGTDPNSHVHIQFADGGKVDVSPDGTMDFKVPKNSPASQMSFGLPKTPEEIRQEESQAPKSLVVKNPDGSFSEVQSGDGKLPGDNKVNPATGLPWTAAEGAEFWNRPENAAQFDSSQLRNGDLTDPNIVQKTNEEMLDELRKQTPLLNEAVVLAQNPQNASEAGTIQALDTLQAERNRQLELDTPASRATAGQLDGLISSASTESGLTQEQNPIDKAAGVVSSITGIAGDVFKVVNSAIEAVGSTKDITSTLVRGIANTEDIFRLVDDFQKYIELAANVANAVGSIASAVGSITGGADFGATAAVGQVAGLISGALETVNAVIDLGQEAYRIVGTYVGDFLGYLAGGAAGPLTGDVKFLLDQETNQLLAYSADNPADKRAHTLLGEQANPDVRNQGIGTVNVYGGPGSDPRDNTRQMMWQVKTAGFAGALP